MTTGIGVTTKILRKSYTYRSVPDSTTTGLPSPPAAYEAPAAAFTDVTTYGPRTGGYMLRGIGPTGEPVLIYIPPGGVVRARI